MLAIVKLLFNVEESGKDVNSIAMSTSDAFENVGTNLEVSANSFWYHEMNETLCIRLLKFMPLYVALFQWLYSKSVLGILFSIM